MPLYNSTQGPFYFPQFRAASYYICAPLSTTGTSATLGNGSLRLTPWYVPRPVSITKIGAEFTVAGSDAASVFRIGIYADDGTGSPTGAAVLDAGTISTGTGDAGTVATGGTPGVYDITVAASLGAGLYWVGGAVQAAAGTQPTMRTLTTGIAPVPSTVIPTAGQVILGFLMTAVTGALPTWSSTTNAGVCPRIHVKTA